MKTHSTSLYYIWDIRLYSTIFLLYTEWQFNMWFCKIRICAAFGIHNSSEELGALMK